MKKCNKCHEEKELTEFYNRKESKDGKRADCKECYEKGRSQYYINNLDIIKVKRSSEYNNNKLLIIEQRKEFYRLNSDKIKEYKRDFYKNNKESILEEKKLYFQKNKDSITKRMSLYITNRRENDPSFKIRMDIARRFRHALLNNNNESLFNITGLLYIDYIDYFKANYPAEFTDITIKGKYHIDHIIPCAIYDFSNPDHIKKCWNPENLRIIPAKENMSKKDKLDFDLIDRHNIRHLLPN